MDRRSLEYFRAVADLGSISAAALRMSVTQPAVSKQIARLEAELSVRLFHRTAHGMSLTPAGETLDVLGGDLLTRFERAEGTLRSRFSGMPEFRVACPPTTAYVLLSPFMAAFDPAIADLVMVPAPDVDGLLDHDVDLAVSTLLPPANREQVVVASLPVTVQATPDLMETRFGDGQVAPLERLLDDLLLVAATGVHVVFDKATAGFEPAPRVRKVAMGFVGQSLAANGHGFVIATEQAQFGLKRLPATAGGQPLESQLYASWNPNHYSAPELRAIAESFSRWLAVTPPWGMPDGE
jgi:DNA-binding transcriptional LysR family regulator